LRKLRNKRFCLVMAILFALTLLAPAAAFAELQPLSAPTVPDGAPATLGSINMHWSAGQLKDGDSCTISLPQNFQFLQQNSTNGNLFGTVDTVMGSGDWRFNSVSGTAYGTKNNYFIVPASAQNINAENALTGATLAVTYLADNQIKLTVSNLQSGVAGMDAYLTLVLNNIYVDSGYDGDIAVTMSSPSGSGFGSGNVVVGVAHSSGSVDIECTNAPAFTDRATGKDAVTLRISESVPGSLVAGDSLKFNLPSGFEWMGVEDLTLLWGEAKVPTPIYTNGVLTGYNSNNLITQDTNALKSTLQGYFVINTSGNGAQLTLKVPNGFKSTAAIAFDVKVGVQVADETKAKQGDITATVSGKTTANVSSLFVGKYGQYEVNIAAGDPTNLIAGRLQQQLPDITVTESNKGSLVPNRTVILTLPSSYKWCNVDTDSSGGITLGDNGVSFPGKDGRTAKWVIGGTSSSKAATLTLKKMEVAIEPGTKGDLVIEVSGTAGLTGELTVGHTVAAATVSSTASTPLTIGAPNQAVGDITITENAAGAYWDGPNSQLLLCLPAGVRWNNWKAIGISVTDGDLAIKSDGIKMTPTVGQVDDVIAIPIDRASTTASTITLTNVSFTLDRTVPEGDVVLKVKGSGVGQVNVASEVKDTYDDYSDAGSYYVLSSNPCVTSTDGALFSATQTGAAGVVATVGTPAPVDQTALTTTITLGDNGSYISDGRIMVQLRNAADALGVAPQNLLWDNTSKTATMLKDNRIVQVTVGNPSVKLNGTSLPTDKGAEIKDGRTFISLSMAGIAFNAVTTWDNTTKTATITVGGTTANSPATATVPAAAPAAAAAAPAADVAAPAAQ